MNNEIVEMSKKLRELTDRKRELEADLKEVNGEIQAVKTTLTEMLEAADMQSVKIPEVGTVYLAPILYVKENKDKHDELISWLDSNKLGDLAPRKINYMTLQALYKERLQNNLSLPPADTVEVKSGMEARLRKA